MRVAFVGVKRKYQELPEDYRMDFTRYHLELPWYFARSGMNVSVVTVDYGPENFIFQNHNVPPSEWSSLEHVPEGVYLNGGGNFDVVVHWRKWFPEFYRPDAINVINCQDHSFSFDWKQAVIGAYREGKLYGILCFPTWHKRNLLSEINDLGGGCFPEERAIDGLTLGVDTDVYYPAEDKDPYQLLWASDPGRGFQQMLPIFLQLHTLDSRFRLNVCWPDYCQFIPNIEHPGIVWRGNVSNGPDLWNLFRKCGVLAYPSTFREPSSRAHRQAMAAGSLVLYPPGMGSPSELIEHGKTGIVSNPRTWPTSILKHVNDGKWKTIGTKARKYAVSENWDVQARRFSSYFENVLRGKR